MDALKICRSSLDNDGFNLLDIENNDYFFSYFIGRSESSTGESYPYRYKGAYTSSSRYDGAYYNLYYHETNTVLDPMEFEYMLLYKCSMVTSTRSNYSFGIYKIDSTTKKFICLKSLKPASLEENTTTEAELEYLEYYNGKYEGPGIKIIGFYGTSASNLAYDFIAILIRKKNS